MTLPRLLFLCAPLPLVACIGAGSPPSPPTTPPEATTAPAPETTPAEPVAVSKGPVRQTWEALVASGCDLKAARIFTSVEARVVRNVPFALKGYRFKDVNLRLIFEADGGWYSPQVDEPPTLSPQESACVDRLKALEAELHKALPFPDEMAARMTRDHALFVVLRMWSESHEASPYGRSSASPKMRRAPGGCGAPTPTAPRPRTASAAGTRFSAPARRPARASRRAERAPG
jgi:hypothetical protein